MSPFLYFGFLAASSCMLYVQKKRLPYVWSRDNLTQQLKTKQKQRATEIWPTHTVSLTVTRKTILLSWKDRNNLSTSQWHSSTVQVHFNRKTNSMEKQPNRFISQMLGHIHQYHMPARITQTNTHTWTHQHQGTTFLYCRWHQYYFNSWRFKLLIRIIYLFPIIYTQSNT